MIVWLLRRFSRPAPPPTCFGSKPGAQQRAENDCSTCASHGPCLREEATLAEVIDRVESGVFYDDYDWASGPALRALRRAAAGLSLDFAFGGAVWPGLAKLAEEKDEVGQVLAKLIQTGGDPKHWSGDMVEKLVEELPDLLAAIHVFVALNPVLHPHKDAMRERFDMKVERFFGWHYDTLAKRT